MSAYTPPPAIGSPGMVRASIPLAIDVFLRYFQFLTKFMKAGRMVLTSEAVRILGCTERELRILFKKGLPRHPNRRKKVVGRRGFLIDIEEARTWGIANGIKAFKNLGDVNGKAKIDATPLEFNREQGLAGSLEFIRRAELVAREDYSKAVAKGDPHLIRATHRIYVETQKQLSETEKQVDSRKLVEEEVWAGAAAAIKAWSEPVRSFLDNLPRHAAARVNRLDPNHAEAVLRDIINKELLPIMSIGLRRTS